MTQPPTQPPAYADDAHRYRLDSRLATGGMGEVWRGTDTTLGRQVAVKLLKHEYADDASFRVRFESEAQHAASLHHPNIAAVYDFGEATASDGSGSPRPYLVMELVEGQPLSALLRPGVPMDPLAVRELLAQAADGLAAAHRAGIVHRDVKPANLLVTDDRRVKVTDFGIARAAAGVGLTSTGEVMGTPQYLSPEQAEGRTATPASDVYALGVVAFECLAGRRPYVGDSPVSTALMHLREPVPELPASVPADLAAVVRRALAKDPDQRFADGRELAAALRSPATAATQVVPPAAAAAGPMTQVLAPTPAAATPAPAAAAADRRRWLWPVVAVLLLALLALLVFLLLTQGGEDKTPAPTPTRTPHPHRTSATPSATPSSTAPSEDTSVRVNEGDYVGRPLSDVQRELADLGLRVDSQQVDNPGGKIEGDVMSVNPSGALQKGDTVTVGYWGPAPPPSPTDSAPVTPPGSVAPSAATSSSS